MQKCFIKLIPIAEVEKNSICIYASGPTVDVLSRSVTADPT